MSAGLMVSMLCISHLSATRFVDEVLDGFDGLASGLTKPGIGLGRALPAAGS